MTILLKSDNLSREGILHGFATRAGGVSDGPYASLNLGSSVGDEPTRVERNHQILAAAAGFPPLKLRTVSQVHGDAVVRARDVGEGVTGDAIVSDDPADVVGVKVADCVPILLFDRRTGHAVAVHAGWRGTRLGVVGRGLEALGDPRDVLAAIGPCIRRCCYEVSEELAADFVLELGAGVTEGRRLDLVEANRRQIAAAGVPTSAVEVVGGCTSCDSARFFSHRRDAGRTGRHLAFIAARSR